MRWQHGHDWHTKAWERVTNTPAGPVLQSHVTGVDKKHKIDTARQQTSIRCGQQQGTMRRQMELLRHRGLAYGLNAAQPDIPKEQLQEICCTYLRSLHVSPQQALDIEEATRQQADDTSGLWYEVRRPRLTGSRFGEVV